MRDESRWRRVSLSEGKGDKPQKDIWYIVNPITKKASKLPKPPTECKCPSGCANGVGFDGSSGTPIVVSLFFMSSEASLNYTLGAEVYDFQERCWRRPRTSRVSPLFPVRVEDEAVSAYGSIHWFQNDDVVSPNGGTDWFRNCDRERRRLDPKIVSFDLRKEELSLLKPPKFKDAGSETGLFESKGSLALVNHSLARHVEVWVLESGSKWTKRYKIGIPAFPENFKCDVTPKRVRYVGQIDREMVLVNFSGRHFFSFCNPEHRRSSRGFDFEHVPLVRLPHIFAFTPTLISLHL